MDKQFICFLTKTAPKRLFFEKIKKLKLVDKNLDKNFLTNKKSKATNKIKYSKKSFK